MLAEKLQEIAVQKCLNTGCLGVTMNHNVLVQVRVGTTLASLSPSFHLYYLALSNKGIKCTINNNKKEILKYVLGNLETVQLLHSLSARASLFLSCKMSCLVHIVVTILYKTNLKECL